MPKKIWTPEERAAFGAKMKASKAAKQAQPAAPTPTEPTAPQESVTITKEQFDTLMARLDKVDNQPATQTQTPDNNSGFDQNGKPQGVIQRYSVDPSYYDSPVEFLFDLPELRREAMRENYELDWNVDQTIYETKYGTSFADPKFTLVLWRKVYDGSELTTKRILIQTGVFFEDPAASVKEAVELGLPIGNANSKQFLAQMRQLRFKQWLLDIFNPSLPTTTKTRVTDTVIGGKVYQMRDDSVVV